MRTKSLSILFIALISFPWTQREMFFEWINFWNKYDFFYQYSLDWKGRKTSSGKKKKKKSIGFIVKELIFELKRFLPQNKVIRMPASALSLWGQLHHQVLCNGSFSKQVSCFSPRAQPISSWSCPCHINLITCQKKEAA